MHYISYFDKYAYCIDSTFNGNVWTDMSFDRYPLQPEPIVFSTEEDALKYVLNPERERHLQRIVIERAMQLTGLREAHLYHPLLGLPREAIRRALRNGTFTSVEHVTQQISDIDIINNATIDTTYFFRVAEMFHALEQMNITPNNILVLPCSTGEEAYSYRMLYQKAQQVHAYDVDPVSIEIAQKGFTKKYNFHRSEQHNALHTAYRERFLHERNFSKVPGGYQISPTVGPVQFRTMNIFSEEFRRDPQVWDLISCMHFFIYLEPDQRDAAIDILVSKLKPGGTLVWDGSNSGAAPKGCKKTEQSYIYQKVAATQPIRVSTPKHTEVTSPRSATIPPSRITPIQIASHLNDAITNMRKQTAALGRACAELRATNRSQIG